LAGNDTSGSNKEQKGNENEKLIPIFRHQNEELFPQIIPAKAKVAQ